MEKDGKQNKWACQKCTYLNFSATLRCCMCNHKKSAVETHSRSFSTPIKLSTDGFNNRYDSLPKLCNTSSSLLTNFDCSLSLIDGAKKLEIQSSNPELNISFKNNNLRLSPLASSSNILKPDPAVADQKWQCLICTYENFPKSAKCIMCATKKEPINSSQRFISNESEYIDNEYDDLACGYNSSSSSTTIVNESYTAKNNLKNLPRNKNQHQFNDLEAQQELLSRLLAQISTNGPSGIKCVSEQIAPDIAESIRRHFGQILRIRKPPFVCSYVNEHATFSLPADIEELPATIREQLFDELLDRDAQKQLEMPPPALNWSLEITSRLGSRLNVLWNSAGDCLLDSLLQATWGVFDRAGELRRALADSLHQCSAQFYIRWKEYEMAYHEAALLHFTLEEQQWEEDWKNLITLASSPGSSLEQLHIFVLCHIFRRPILVYGVKYIRSWGGENFSPARFEGLYLPFLWEQSFCIKSPLALGYTRGHFSALVPSEQFHRLDATREEEDVTFLPLIDTDHKLIPIHFLSQNEMGHEEKIMRSWLDVCFTPSGLMVAQQKLHKRPLLVAQMLEEWLNYYRRKAQIISPMVRGIEDYLSYDDGDTDEE